MSTQTPLPDGVYTSNQNYRYRPLKNCSCPVLQQRDAENNRPNATQPQLIAPTSPDGLLGHSVFWGV
eukprot:3066301-Amphidinium_carterae.1